MRVVPEGTWNIKHVPGTDFPFHIIFTTNSGRECTIDGFHTVEAATRGLNEIFDVLTDKQPVIIA